MSAVQFARWWQSVDEIHASPPDPETGTASAWIPGRGRRSGWYRRVDSVWHRVPENETYSRSATRGTAVEYGTPYPITDDEYFVAALDDAVRIVTD